jgi:hypothetical protein
MPRIHSYDSGLYYAFGGLKLYRRRRLRIHDDVCTSYGAPDPEANNVLSTNEEKEVLLRHASPMSLGGAIYAEWKNAIEQKESLVLRVLGFTLYWISDSHPHRFIVYFIRVLEIEDGRVCFLLSCDNWWLLLLELNFISTFCSCQTGCTKDMELLKRFMSFGSLCKLIPKSL